jgi:hypothetical protein
LKNIFLSLQKRQAVASQKRADVSQKTEHCKIIDGGRRALKWVWDLLKEKIRSFISHSSSVQRA